MIIGSDYHSDNVKSFLQFAIQIVVAHVRVILHLAKDVVRISKRIQPTHMEIEH